MNKRPLALMAFALMTSFPAYAQGTLLGIRDVDEEIDDLRRAAEININRGNDPRRFGPSEQREGLSGSLSLSYSGSSGSTDEQDLSFGARLTDVRGPLVQTLGFIVSFDETNGARTEEDICATYDLTYDWNTNFYGFVLGRVTSDGVLDTKAMQHSRVDRNDILEAARRQHGIAHLEEIDAAVLEASGGLSIIPNRTARRS